MLLSRNCVRAAGGPLAGIREKAIGKTEQPARQSRVESRDAKAVFSPSGPKRNPLQSSGDEFHGEVNSNTKGKAPSKENVSFFRFQIASILEERPAFPACFFVRDFSLAVPQSSRSPGPLPNGKRQAFPVLWTAPERRWLFLCFGSFAGLETSSRLML